MISAQIKFHRVGESTKMSELTHHDDPVILGEAVVSSFAKLCRQTPEFSLTATTTRWLSPSNLTPVFARFLSRLRAVLTPDEQDVSNIIREFGPSAAERMFESVEYYQHLEADFPRFIQGLENDLDSLVQIQRRRARHLATQAYRLTVAAQFGHVGQPAFMRRLEAQMQQGLRQYQDNYVDDAEIWDGKPLFTGGVNDVLYDSRGESYDVWLTPRPVHHRPPQAEKLYDAIMERAAHTLHAPVQMPRAAERDVPRSNVSQTRPKMRSEPSRPVRPPSFISGKTIL